MNKNWTYSVSVTRAISKGKGGHVQKGNAYAVS